MTHVLVVHHDVDVADLEVDTLRRAGYVVTQCAGPAAGPCPVLAGRRCWMADAADVLVYDVWASGDGGRELIAGLRELYPATPIILTAAGQLLDWVAEEGPYGVSALVGAPSHGDLTNLIEAVTVPHGMSAVVGAQ
jgi:DNA-binding NtrC family response regulator